MEGEPRQPADVLIIGAGPVGLFLANLLGSAGLRCVLLERRADEALPSMAIGVMPPSLRRFAAVGVAGEAVAAGCPVSGAVVRDEARVLGRLDLSALPPPYPFILSLPQGRLMKILAQRLAAWPNVEFLRQHEFVAARQDADAVEARVRRVGSGETFAVRASYLVGCDGHESTVRASLGTPFSFRRYRPGFVMGDFLDRTGWAGEAHLFFTPSGAIESFPLPAGRRRWVAQCERGSPRRDPSYLAERVEAIVGMRLPLSEMVWNSSFRPSRLLCKRFFEGRIALCGDAAHVISPIGGQGMNTGFGDAWHLGGVFAACVKNRAAHGPLLAGYQKARRRAAKVAAARAARGMWVGTREGRVPSALRSLFLGRILFRPPLLSRLAPYFAMLTIPEPRSCADEIFKETGPG